MSAPNSPVGGGICPLTVTIAWSAHARRISGMTEAAHDDYQLPEEFEHCSKLAPVRDAPSALDRVKQVVRILHEPGGCLWDGEQTNTSLLKPLLEETYEYIDAVETNDRDNMREELGDMLLQSVFPSASMRRGCAGSVRHRRSVQSSRRQAHHPTSARLPIRRRYRRFRASTGKCARYVETVGSDETERKASQVHARRHLPRARRIAARHENRIESTQIAVLRSA